MFIWHHQQRKAHLKVSHFFEDKQILMLKLVFGSIVSLSILSSFYLLPTYFKLFCQNNGFYWLMKLRSSHRRCFVKKTSLKVLQNSQENTCVGVSSKPEARNFVIKDTPTQVVSYFTEHIQVIASANSNFANFDEPS